MDAPIGRWTRVRTLGRGATGAEVFLAADEASGRLFAVKSVPERGAAALVREQEVMADLRSPHVVPCAGGRARRDGSYQLFLEFAPGGSLADEAARNGGRLEERDVRRYAADVARGLAHIHGAGVVHGDVKPRNVVLGADARAKLTDFGCARRIAASPRPPAGGTPAFMAPEVARGEEQGPAADVWALGCTVIAMATGRAPWSHVGDALAAVRLIGYTDAVPDVPEWLSAEAKDLVSLCLARRPSDRPTAAELLQHPFIRDAESGGGSKGNRWVSPKSTMDAAFWESDTDDEDDELACGAARRIGSLACSVSTVPDWDSEDDELACGAARRIGSLACSFSTVPDWDSEEEEGWIDVTSTPSVPAEGKAAVDDAGVVSSNEVEFGNAEVEPLVDVDGDSEDSAHDVGGPDDASPGHEARHQRLILPACERVPCNANYSVTRTSAMDFVLAQNSLCSPPVTSPIFRRLSFIPNSSVSCGSVLGLARTLSRRRVLSHVKLENFTALLAYCWITARVAVTATPAVKSTGTRPIPSLTSLPATPRAEDST
jgi:mitogen-activated protein kinase kinase kinase 17/18